MPSAEAATALPPGAPPSSARAAEVVDRRPEAITVAIDDDPTGAQTVAGVPLVASYDVAALRWLLRNADRLGFLLTNSRSLPRDDAVEVARRVGRALATAAAAEGVDVRLLSRSDSTLRGHFPAEVDALLEAWHAAGGARHDGVLLCPAYVEAGRLTLHGRHWVRVGAQWTPAGETDYAKDATFGYTASDLPAWVEERSVGRVRAADVRVLDIETIRSGVEATAAALLQAPAGGVVAADALDNMDLDTLSGALDLADLAGRRYLLRTGPSLVRASAGIPVGDPIALRRGPAARVLIAVGSHTPLTRRQVAIAASAGSIAVVEVAVTDVIASARAGASGRGEAIARAVDAAVRALDAGDVIVQTSPTLIRSADGEESLAIARQVSSALTEIVGQVVARAKPDLLIAKGGITSHDIATKALGMSRAWVRGCLLPGLLSVWEPVSATPGRGPTLIVFAGNVGDDRTLWRVLDIVHRAPLRPEDG